MAAEPREVEQIPLYPENGSPIVTLTIPVTGATLRAVLARAERTGMVVTMAGAAILAAGAELEPGSDGGRRGPHVPVGNWTD